MSLALWLQPPSGVAAILQESIDKLSKAANSDQFLPHVTVTTQVPSDIDREALQGIADRLLGETSVSFTQLVFGTYFFKNAFIRVERSESLLELTHACRALFDPEVDTWIQSYDPHVSLIYSNIDILYHPELKEAAVQAYAHIAESCQGWVGGSLALVDCFGSPVAEWTPLWTSSSAKS
ncbi:hypothetical protein CANCADRAFT_86218 [Tortispora caseinolytica NRRL Y-17796]|uniref:2',3'-cyclic-nucleotide 3'-phosphodiesterase n=1 Tax=Tortispora caseinolytica NRRL Y-17796 TaxID=767744 RepID=A0A1E4TKZ9_9ASCO|nr:hypothetical protein CANCADRAFT_86218 [Tortispora caseinolytica NRRL Y-17796]